MKRPSSLVWIVATLITASAIVYAIDFVVYPDLHDTMGFYALLDVAFIPVNVLIVGLFINRLLATRERAELLHKMNMVVGAFFTQVGNELIGRLSRFDSDLEKDRPHLRFDKNWSSSDFDAHRRAVRADAHAMDLGRSDVEALRDLLATERPFMLGLLQNGSLLEHEGFTDALWAVSHLSEELSARSDLSDLPSADRIHLERDMGLAYGRLLGEWLGYIRHLKADYPYLFFFAMRTNPFDPDAEVEVTD